MENINNCIRKNKDACQNNMKSGETEVNIVVVYGTFQMARE